MHETSEQIVPIKISFPVSPRILGEGTEMMVREFHLTVGGVVKELRLDRRGRAREERSLLRIGRIRNRLAPFVLVCLEPGLERPTAFSHVRRRRDWAVACETAVPVLRVGRL